MAGEGSDRVGRAFAPPYTPGLCLNLPETKMNRCATRGNQPAGRRDSAADSGASVPPIMSSMNKDSSCGRPETSALR